MYQVLLGIAAVGAAFLFGCARHKEVDSPHRIQTFGKTEEIKDENVIIRAGGLDNFILGKMQPDNHFRLYMLFAEWCDACKEMNKSVVKLQENRRDLDYTKIDIEGFEQLTPPTSIPTSILQYDDCTEVDVLQGVATPDELQRLMFSLALTCEREKLSGEETSDPPPFESISL